MLGIALGGLASGFEKGVGLGEKMRKAEREAEIDEQIKQAVEAGRADTANAIAKGAIKPDDPDAILRFTMPRLVAPLMRAGKLDEARTAADWLRSDTTRRATNDWATGMIAAQNGDMKTALQSFVKAARTKGYGADYEIGDPEDLGNGAFRVSVTGKDGRTFSKEFQSPSEVTAFGAIHLNPEVKFKEWLKQQQTDREVAADTAKARGRKQVGIEFAPAETDIAVDRRRKEGQVDLENEKAKIPTFLERFKGQKDIELETDQRRQQLGLGPPAYEPWTYETTDESGKTVSKPYRFNRRSGEFEPAPGLEGSGRLTKPTGLGGAGNGRQSVFQQRLAVGNALYGEGTKEAADYAAGKRTANEQEIRQFAIKQAAKENPYNAAKRKEREQEIFDLLRSMNSNTPMVPRSVPTTSEPPFRPAQQRPDLMTPGNGNKPIDESLAPAPKPQSGLRVPPAAVIENARAAIAKGADRAAVIKRLNDYGYDAGGI